jgi:hypothetical protein
MDWLLYVTIGLALVGGGWLVSLVVKHGWGWVLAQAKARKVALEAEAKAKTAAITAPIEQRVATIEADLSGIKAKITALGGGQ